MTEFTYLGAWFQQVRYLEYLQAGSLGRTHAVVRIFQCPTAFGLDDKPLDCFGVRVGVGFTARGFSATDHVGKIALEIRMA